MVKDQSVWRKVFIIGNYVFLTFLCLLSFFPLVHVVALSFSSSEAAAAGLVWLWAVDFTTASYEFVLEEPAFLRSLQVAVERVVLGTAVNMLLTILIAYPLAKEVEDFKWRTIYAWFFVFTILFSGGLIPWFLTVRFTGIMDTIWALVLPQAVPVFNVVLLLNFFRGLPRELAEAAYMDGASEWIICWRIYVPLSVPALATVTLFAMVWHWNAWFDGLIFMNSPHNYPLQTYLHTVVIQQDFALFGATAEEIERLVKISDRTLKSAQIFLAAIPIVAVYPFLQKYFMAGIVLGSVKE